MNKVARTVRHLRRLVAQPGIVRFGRFCLVGGSGATLNMLLLWILTEAGMHYFYSGLVATATATTWNYTLNDLVTWRDRRRRSVRSWLQRYAQYWAVTAVGSALQLMVLVLLTRAGVPYLVSNVAGIGPATLWNFHANERWTWKPAAHAGQGEIPRG